MGLGVYFTEDLAHILRGVGESVSLLVAQRGLHDAADTIGRQLDTAYVAGYYAALRAVATSLGLGPLEFGARGWRESEQCPQALAQDSIWRGEVVWDGQGRTLE